jgi:hypothetical protein
VAPVLFLGQEIQAVNGQLLAFSKKNGAGFSIGGHSVQLSRSRMDRISRRGAGYFVGYGQVATFCLVLIFRPHPECDLSFSGALLVCRSTVKRRF